MATEVVHPPDRPPDIPLPDASSAALTVPMMAPPATPKTSRTLKAGRNTPALKTPESISELPRKRAAVDFLPQGPGLEKVPVIDVYANFSIIELRNLLRVRDSQMEQLSSAFNASIKSAENLSKSLAQLTKTHERLVDSMTSRDNSFPSLARSDTQVALLSSVGSASAAAPSSGPLIHGKPSFATIAHASKDLPLQEIEVERQARLRSMQPLSPAARRQRQVRSSTPASEYSQCYVKLASKRISMAKNDLEFIGVRVDLIHNIAFPTTYAAEFTYLKKQQDELYGSIRKSGLRLLPDFHPARPAKANPSQDLKDRVRAQYVERMTSEILSAHHNGARGLAEYFKSLVSQVQEGETTPPSSQASSPAVKSPEKTGPSASAPPVGTSKTGDVAPSFSSASPAEDCSATASVAAVHDQKDQTAMEEDFPSTEAAGSGLAQ
ncbi:hypothetical protein CF326_g4577 [Tilletia indica]|nr:hypothetical protein CF326_g4577 [Tilletia indica]